MNFKTGNDIISHLSSPIGQMVMDGNGIVSIGTCHTAVITGFASHPLKHWSMPIIDNANPIITIKIHIALEYQFCEIPRNDMPCNVDVEEKVRNKSFNVASLPVVQNEC